MPCCLELVSLMALLRRECERAWSALGTEDRMRKKERNTVRQVRCDDSWDEIGEFSFYKDTYA